MPKSAFRQQGSEIFVGSYLIKNFFLEYGQNLNAFLVDVALALSFTILGTNYAKTA